MGQSWHLQATHLPFPPPQSSSPKQLQSAPLGSAHSCWGKAPANDSKSSIQISCIMHKPPFSFILALPHPSLHPQ